MSAQPPPPSVLLDLLFILGGVVVLYFGAEVLVRGAAALALRQGLSPLLVGLTVVAFGTSAPELVVSVEAALSGQGGIAVGNVVGSNIANVALILGVAALIRPLRVDPQLVRMDIPLTIAVSVLATALLADGTLGRPEGLVLAGGLVAYLTYSIRAARRDPSADLLPAELEAARPAGGALRDVVFIGGGLGLLVLGSHALVGGAVGVAEVLGVPPTIIGLSIVAIGTSLPELATSALASVRGQGDLAIGNVVGSNLFNLLGILGVAAVTRPLGDLALSPVDFAAMVAAVVLLLPLAASRRTLSRLDGGALTFLYVVYLGYLVLR
jgi:cation:H+ antiporter